MVEALLGVLRFFFSFFSFFFSAHASSRWLLYKIRRHTLYFFFLFFSLILNFEYSKCMASLVDYLHPYTILD